MGNKVPPIAEFGKQASLKLAIGIITDLAGLMTKPCFSAHLAINSNARDNTAVPASRFYSLQRTYTCAPLYIVAEWVTIRRLRYPIF